MSTVRIVTDSTADIPAAYAQRLGVTVIPCFVNIGAQSYRDIVDLSRADFYSAMPGMTEVARTSGPPSGDFAQAYHEAGRDGAEIVSLHPPISVSGIFNSARLGAEECGLPPGRVVVLDAGQTSMGLGWQVIMAAQWAAQGLSAGEIAARVQALGQGVHVYAALDSLEYLRRSGRVNWMQAQLGALLQLKLIIELYCGQVTQFDRVRSHHRSHERLVQAAEALAPLAHAAVMHSGIAADAAWLRDQLGWLVPGQDIPIIEATPAIVAHVGPNALGIALVSAKQSVA